MRPGSRGYSSILERRTTILMLRICLTASVAQLGKQPRPDLSRTRPDIFSFDLGESMEFAGQFEQQVRQSIEASIATKERLLADANLVATVGSVSEILIDAFRAGNKVLLFGNGGSAADAQHIAAEFVGRFAIDRPALPAVALSVNTSCVTAIG